MHRSLISLFCVGLVATALNGAGLAAAPTPSGSPRWIVQPTCTATTSELTCTGKAAGVVPKQLDDFSPIEVGITGRVDYSCNNPVFPVSWIGFANEAIGVDAFHNGQTFTATATPPAIPPVNIAQVFCHDDFTRDPNYYDIHVKVGWGYGSGHSVTALDATIGTVTAG
jgi:hypothetical protein